MDSIGIICLIALVQFIGARAMQNLLTHNYKSQEDGELINEIESIKRRQVNLVNKVDNILDHQLQLQELLTNVNYTVNTNANKSVKRIDSVTLLHDDYTDKVYGLSDQNPNEYNSDLLGFRLNRSIKIKEI